MYMTMEDQKLEALRKKAWHWCSEQLQKTVIEQDKQLRQVWERREKNEKGPSLDDTVASGWLYKKSTHGLIKGWKSRFFVLREHCLEYYEKEGDTKKNFTTSLTNIEEVIFGDHDFKPNGPQSMQAVYHPGESPEAGVPRKSQASAGSPRSKDRPVFTLVIE